MRIEKNWHIVSSKKSVEANHRGQLGTLASGEPVKFMLPDNLRGWFFLERCGLAVKEKTHLILQCNGSTDLTKIKQLLKDAYPAQALLDHDKKGQYLFDDDYYYDPDSTYDDYPYDEFQDPDEEYEEGYEGEVEDEDPMIQCVEDEEGYQILTQPFVAEINQAYAAEDEAYAEALLNFNQARDVLKQLQVARQFYPVVVPAGTFKTYQKGKGKGKGKGRGKGKRGKGKGNRSGKGKTPSNRDFGKSSGGKGRGTPVKGPRKPFNPPKPGDGACFKCGKLGHYSKDCPDNQDDSNNPLKRQRNMLMLEDEDSCYVSLDLGYMPDDEPIYCMNCKIESSTLVNSIRCPNQDHDHSSDVAKAVEFHEERALAAIRGDHEGCALIDSGASRGITSYTHLDSIHQAYKDEGQEDFYSRPQPSGLKFKIGNGALHETRYSTTIKPIQQSPMRGKQYQVHVSTGDNNTAPMVIGMDYLVLNRCIIDFEAATLSYKDEPGKIHYLKRAKNGSLLMPLTRDQCDNYWRVEDIKDESNLLLEG